MQGEARLRLDKWLWAARFYKTRSQATQAINGGKIHYNGQRVKSSQRVEIGAQIAIGQTIIIVQALANIRRSAKEAAVLYVETPASQAARIALAEQKRLINATSSGPSQRPDKKQRRQIIRFKQQFP